MRNDRSWMATAVFCTLVGLASVLLASAPASADDAVQTAGKSSPYRLVSALTAAGDTWFLYRINTETGDAWSLPDTGWAWLKIPDTAKLPSGDYDLKVIATGVGNNSGTNVFRIERKTGRTWFHENGGWTLFTEPN